MTVGAANQLMARIMLYYGEKEDHPEKMLPIQLPQSWKPLSPDYSDLMPVVFLHGMGDSGSNPGMQSLCQTARDAYPGLYVVCANVANGLASVTTPISSQVDELSQLVKADPRLAHGFNAVGLSQGGLVLRGYVESVNKPPVFRLITICAPHEGIGSCPTVYHLVCPLWRLAPYTAGLAFADYWKDASDRPTYIERSRWLADINNERPVKNAKYVANMLQLERYVLVEATRDETVVPHASESHGFYAWGTTPGANGPVLRLRETEGYREDHIGLLTLDRTHRIFEHTFEGTHLRFASEFWAHTVLPHIGP